MQKLLLLLFLFSNILWSQEEDKILFSEALSLNIKKYNTQADEAFEENRVEYAKSLFDSLVTNHLEGSYLDNLNFDSFKTDLESTSQFTKPTILLTYTSWCIPSAGEIPALNKLAREYGELMNFVVLFWDNKYVVREKSKLFDKSIKVVYVDETQNRHMQTVKLLKHSLGLSLSFVISADQEILDINRRLPNSLSLSEEESFAYNISFISEQVAAIYLDLNLNINDLPESLVTF